MKIGDFVLLDFVGRIAATNEIFDLTDEVLAKRENVYNKEQKYRPSLVIVGAKMVVPGVEEEIIKMSAGEEKEFLVKPENGLGQRNPRLIKIISTANFLKQNINPAPGIHVTIDNIHAKIQSVSGGRVRVDFNHPLAGRELFYRIKIVKELKEPKEKIEALLEHYSIKAETRINGETILIEGKTDPATQTMISETIKKWIKDIKEVKFNEVPSGTDKI